MLIYPITEKKLFGIHHLKINFAMEGDHSFWGKGVVDGSGLFVLFYLNAQSRVEPIQYSTIKIDQTLVNKELRHVAVFLQ